LSPPRQLVGLFPPADDDVFVALSVLDNDPVGVGGAEGEAVYGLVLRQGRLDLDVDRSLR
jgi:hypothetical protein